MKIKYDFITFSLVLSLLLVGGVVIFSATQTITGDTGDLFYKQLFWFSLGLAVLFGISFIPTRSLQRSAYILYGLSIIGLILVMFIGKAGQGAERWLSFGFIRFQPSEFAKIATILAVSKLLSDKYADVNRFKYFAMTIGVILLPAFLIVEQPDLGTSLVFLALIIPTLFWAGLNWFYIFVIITPILVIIASFTFWAFLIVMLIISFILFYSRRKPLVIAAVFTLNIAVGIVTPYLWGQLRPYQQQRIVTFINPEKDPKGSGYQIIQSQVAIGSGGITGKGYLNGSQTHLRFLPAQHTDFIFSVIGEEFGFIGCAFVLLLFLLLILRLIFLTALVRDSFETMILIGVVTIIFFHVVINIGMTIGMAPVTGLPLPFISYGGSFLLTNMTMIGIVIGIVKNKVGLSL
jgi:rod shape determining protein RodA